MSVNNLRLMRHHPVLDDFAAQLAANCGDTWEALSEPVRDYYREISRKAINDGLRGGVAPSPDPKEP